jgi:hypothetical protein
MGPKNKIESKIGLIVLYLQLYFSIKVLNLDVLFLDSLAFTYVCLQPPELYDVFNSVKNIVTRISDYRRVFGLDDLI